MNYKIMIIEDDPDIAELVSRHLEKFGFTIEKCIEFHNVLKEFEKAKPHLVLLDINLPAYDGFYWCGKIREKSSCPIIFLSSRNADSDQVYAMMNGGDDYVTKPFPMSVFQKKLAALLSRIAKQSEEDKYNDGTFAIDFKEMTASLEGKALVFTPLEYRLLKIFTKNPQNVLTRQMLLERLWDIDENFVDEHALTVAVSRVRNKIETNGQQYIKTVYGMGYMWVGGVQK